MPTEQRRHTVAALVAQIAGPIDTGLLVRGLAALEDAVSALRDQLAATTARADRLDLLVETERGRIVTIEAKAVAAEQGRDRAEAQAAELRALLEQAEAAAEKARREAVHEARKAAQAFDALRAVFVEAARLAQGLLARLRAAWRGQ
jgi:chromosome segregation ATPase